MTDHESMSPSASASKRLPAPTPMRRLREAANELWLAATRALAWARVRWAKTVNLPGEVGREAVGVPEKFGGQ